MKKIIILALSLMLLFTACSPNGNTDDVTQEETTTEVIVDSLENYVGEATLETIKTLVNMHATFETEYFAKNHAPVNMSKEFDVGGIKFAPVNGGKFSTYKELKQAVYDTYTKESADFLLNNSPMYAEIDGAFCFNTASAEAFRGDSYTYDWTNFTIEPTEASDDRIVFTVFLKYSGGDDAAITMTAVAENGNWRLVR